MKQAQIVLFIGRIGKAAAKLTADIQLCAVECGMHAIEHGDVTLADRLVDAVGKGVRRASLRAWFECNTPMYLPKGKDKFAFDAERVKAMRADTATHREEITARPWEEAKPEEAVISVLDVGEAFDKFIKRLHKSADEPNMTVKGRDLLDTIEAAARDWHAEQLVKSIKQLSPAEMTKMYDLPKAKEAAE